MEDLYKTISSPSKGIYKEKGSKFIAVAFSIFSKEEFKDKLNELKKEYHDARHHCYAYKLGLTENEYKYSDDGEPNNSAGAPIFGQIKSFELTNIAIIVVRYFGGTKLGVGGLVTAYKEAAKDALKSAKIIEITVDNIYEIQFEYKIMSDVMNFIKQQQLEVINQTLEEKGTIQFRIRQSEATTLLKKLETIAGINIQFLKTV
jgi:uncharacterized YigZ family protein